MKKNAIPLIAGLSTILVVIIVVLLASCSKNGQPDLKVELTQPKTGEQFYASRQVFVGAAISGKESWSRIELWANNLMVQSATNAQVQTNTPSIPWTPIDLGPTMLEVRVYNRSGSSYVKAKSAITIVENPTAPTTEPTADLEEPTPTVAPTKENCTVAATLLADLSIPAGTELKPSQSFTKSWRVHNNGSCDWVDYKLVYISGSMLGGNSPSNLRTVRSGEVIDIALELTAPSYPGEYIGTWKIQTDKGSLLETELLYRIVIPAPTATPSPTATKRPTSTPKPSSTPKPTNTPTNTPTVTATPIPTQEPTEEPTAIPSVTPEPTLEPRPHTLVAMNPSDIANGQTLELSVSCNDVGGHVVSGGYTLSQGISLQASQPVANGWSITATNNSGKKQRISVHATCLVDAQLKRDVAAIEATAIANQETQVDIATDGLITGLGYQLGSANQLHVLGFESGDNTANLKIANSSDSDLPVLFQAINLRQATFSNRSVYPKTTRILTKETKQIELSCAKGLSMGATFVNLSQLPMTINRPTLNGWLFEVTNNSGKDIDFETVLICFDSGMDTIQPIIEKQLN